MSALVILSYNIHRGVGIDGRCNLDRIADVIAESEPHVVGLQEVVWQAGVPHADQASYLAARLGMEPVTGETRAHAGGSYGNAVLTRLAVHASVRHDLTWERREPRGCLRVDVDLGGRAIHVFNCHLGLRMRERRGQLELLAALLADAISLAGPRVLMGDFNEWHRGPITRTLRREFPSPMRRLCRTHPAPFPIFPLDRIYWDAELEGSEFYAHRSRLARVASDHLPVVARLSLGKQAHSGAE